MSIATLLIGSAALAAGTLQAQSSAADSLSEHARTAATPADARRDYLRIIVDYPFSSRTEEALLRAGQIEYDSGDKISARRHLERLAAEYPGGPTRAHGAFWFARVLLDAGEPLPACEQLVEAKAGAKSTEVEFLGRVNYYAQPCTRLQAGVANSIAHADSAARVDSAERAKPAKKGVGKRDVAKKTISGPAWSAQLAAYASKADADALARKLTKRGFEGRVTATKPYRVRIGRFRTRAEAVELVQRLRDAKMAAIAVEAERP
jgi:hypothetical protein